mmetsp:Transcript_124815/g.347547  ORF Transcript_124815/g.347547 Transcript_124815/m.347547 type:complete len:84 (+) Transcript_124815:195-446(+)
MSGIFCICSTACVLMLSPGHFVDMHTCAKWKGGEGKEDGGTLIFVTVVFTIFVEASRELIVALVHGKPTSLGPKKLTPCAGAG